MQDFWATCACPKNQSCSENLHFFEIFFIIQNFWATCACPAYFSSRGGLQPPGSYAYVHSCIAFGFIEF